jgi:hypothetical protein
MTPNIDNEHRNGLDKAGVDIEALLQQPHPYLRQERDAKGNGQGREFAPDPSVVDQAPLEDTPLPRALDVIASRFPGEASRLHHAYDRKVLPQGVSYRQAIQEELARLDARNRAAQEANADLEERAAALAARREEALAPSNQRIQGLLDALAAARQEAAVACAKTGGSFDPAMPSDDCVLFHRRPSLQQMAANLGRPWAWSRNSGPSAALWAYMTLVVGAMVGVGLVLASGIVSADLVAKRWPIALIAAMVGFGLAAGGKHAILRSFHRVGQYRYSGPPRDYTLALVVAIATFLIILAADVAVECGGLLARVRVEQSLSALSGNGHSGSLTAGEYLFWIMGMVITFGYLVCAASVGYEQGRRDEIGAQLLAEQERQFFGVDQQRRQDPMVMEALAKLGQVRLFEHQIKETRQQAAEASSPYQRQIERLYGERRQVAESLSPEAVHRIQDARDNHVGAQVAFDKALEAALRQAEPMGEAAPATGRSWFSRLTDKRRQAP